MDWQTAATVSTGQILNEMTKFDSPEYLDGEQVIRGSFEKSRHSRESVFLAWANSWSLLVGN
jgi:hypothetical protein